MPPGCAVQSRSNRHPPVKHRATLPPSVPAGAQIAFAPEQLAALVQASDAQTFDTCGASPPHLGPTGPRRQPRGGLASAPQSAVLQHWSNGFEQLVASGTLVAQTR